MLDGGYFTGRAGLTRDEKIADYTAMLRDGLRQVEEAERGALIAHGTVLAVTTGLMVGGHKLWSAYR
jgi:hypothetical protein